MNQKPALIFSIEKKDSVTEVVREYQLIVPVGAPYGELLDVAFELLTTAQSLVDKAVQDAADKKSVTPEA